MGHQLFVPSILQFRKENPTRCNSVLIFLFHIYVKVNLFRAIQRPSSGA